MTTPSLRDLTRESLRIGLLGFGGPIGQIALMHRVFIDERRWIDEPRFLHALNLCMVLPGPEAHQLSIYLGWLLRGVRGGLIAGTLFVLPGALVVLALSSLYLAFGQLPAVAALFFGIKAAVLALIAEAGVRLARRALTRFSDALIATASLLALALWQLPFPAVIVAALLVGLVRGETRISSAAVVASGTDSEPRRSAWWAALAALAAWWLPVALLWTLDRDGTPAQVAGLFSRMSLVSFGGAYALLAYLKQQAVDVQGWLSAGSMIDGLGLAETTPGPLVLVNQFVGMAAGWNAGGGWGLALACAALASWCTFLPSFVWIFAGAAYAERLRASRHARAALAAIRAAVLGVIAQLALWFSFHVLFRTQSTLAIGGGRIELPELASLDPRALLIATAAAIALWRRLPVAWVVVGAALSGLGLHRFG